MVVKSPSTYHIIGHMISATCLQAALPFEKVQLRCLVVLAIFIIYEGATKVFE